MNSAWGTCRAEWQVWVRGVGGSVAAGVAGAGLVPLLPAALVGAISGGAALGMRTSRASIYLGTVITICLCTAAVFREGGMDSREAPLLMGVVIGVCCSAGWAVAVAINGVMEARRQS